jgi:hypothetical protein
VIGQQKAPTIEGSRHNHGFWPVERNSSNALILFERSPRWGVSRRLNRKKSSLFPLPEKHVGFATEKVRFKWLNNPHRCRYGDSGVNRITACQQNSRTR